MELAESNHEKSRKTASLKRSYNRGCNINVNWIPSQDKILTLLITFMICVDLLIIGGSLITSLSSISNMDLYLAIVMLFILTIVLLLNIKGYFIISSVLFITTISISIFVTSIINFLGMNPYYSSADVNILILLIFPVLISGLLLPNKWGIIFSLFIGAGLLSLPFFFSNIFITDILLGPFLLFGSISFLTITTSYYQGEIEKKKRYQVMQNKKDLEHANQELSNAKNELQLFNDHLEDLVAQRTEQIEILIQQKNELINQLGHDLKNPLGPMINLLPVLIKKENDQKKLEILKSIHRSAQYMKNLVIKTIKLAKLNSPNTEFTFNNLNLHDIINDIAESNMLQFEENMISFDNQVPQNITVKADKLQLQELFNNLFNNAVKYADKNGNIYVKATPYEDKVKISVEDNGIGMTKEQIKKIFDEYYKADNSRHDFDSSGLGMAICKRIITKHGGRIWAESNGPGKGSTFHFTLPILKTHTYKDNGQEINSDSHTIISQQVDDMNI